MSRFRSLRSHILLAFALVTLTVCCCLCLVGWIYSANIDRNLLEEQTAPVMAMLIETEKQSLRLKDRTEDTLLESDALASSLGLIFLVGKQVPASVKNLGIGLHMVNNDRDFILIKEDSGILYALQGSLGVLPIMRGSFLRIWLVCIAISLALALVVGRWLATLILTPLARLTAEVEKCETGMAASGQKVHQFPADLLERADETGLLCRALADSQNRLHDYLMREICFTGDISHELRTPLTIISGCAELLAAKSATFPPKEQKELAPLIDRLERNAANCGRIVTTLLALARPASASQSRKVSLWQLLEQVIASLRSNAEIAGKTIRTSCDINACAIGDAGLMEIAISNLLANALSYSEDNCASLTLDSQSLEICNKGNLPVTGNIYDIASAGVAIQGHGIGLSLAARACDRLGWRLECLNDKGRVTLRINFKNMS